MKLQVLFLYITILLVTSCHSQDTEKSGPPIDEDSLTRHQALAPKLSWEDLPYMEIKEEQKDVIFLFHTTSEFTRAILQGYQDESLGEPTWVMDGQLDPMVQVRDIERALLLKPKYLIILAMDEQAVVKPLEDLAQQGTKIILLSHLPDGFEHPRDFISLIGDDLNAMGREAAIALADSMDEQGQIAVLYHHWNYYVTNSRDRSFIQVIEQEYPNLNIVEQRGIQSMTEAEILTIQLVQEYPDLEGIYLPWATLADGALSALKRLGREDIHLISYDLNQNNAMDLIYGSNYCSVISDRPYQMGKAIAQVIAMDQQDIEIPAMVLFSPLRVTQENLEQSWIESTGTRLPSVLGERQ